MGIKSIVALTFDGRKDRELLAKLNAVAPYARKKVHTLARGILIEKLDEMISSCGITIDFSQGSRS